MRMVTTSCAQAAEVQAKGAASDTRRRSCPLGRCALLREAIQHARDEASTPATTDRVRSRRFVSMSPSWVCCGEWRPYESSLSNYECFSLRVKTARFAWGWGSGAGDWPIGLP